VRSRLADPTPERGGRAKRYFVISAAGRAALERARAIIHAMWDGMEPTRGKG
jgi:hypothetical protein